MEMRKMPKLVSRPAHTNLVVSRLRTDGQEGTGREEQPSVSRSQASSKATATRAEGIAATLAPAIGAGEGCRILVFGRTRWGKSTFARHLINAAIESGVCGTALIHDVKYPDHAQYVGEEVSSITQIGQAVQRGSVVVLRPPCPAREAAHAAVVLSLSGERTLLLVDETRRALGGQQIWCDTKNDDGSQGPRSFEWLCLEGGGVGASLVLLVQRPRQLPGDAVDSAQVNVVFGLGGRSLAYLVSAGTVPPEASETIKALPPGAFCLFSDDESWNRQIYYSPES
jgi:hypothetical protein